MLTRENSATLSLRVLKSELAEFRAVCDELGVQPARTFRDHFRECLDELRAQVNRRRLPGELTWEERWEMMWGVEGERGVSSVGLTASDREGE